jgi:hypothetical protein
LPARLYSQNQRQEPPEEAEKGAAVMTYEPGFDRCYKCHRVTAGIWRGKGKHRYFSCLRCFGVWVRKMVRILAEHRAEYGD